MVLIIRNPPNYNILRSIIRYSHRFITNLIVEMITSKISPNMSASNRMPKTLFGLFILVNLNQLNGPNNYLAALTVLSSR